MGYKMKLHVEDYRMDPETLKTLKVSSPRKVRRKRGEKFLRGPVPWSWLTAAAKLPSSSFRVGIALWLLKGMRYRNSVTLGNKFLDELNVDRAAKARGLSALEAAGLISIERQQGRAPVVSILNCPESDDQKSNQNGVGDDADPE